MKLIPERTARRDGASAGRPMGAANLPTKNLELVVKTRDDMLAMIEAMDADQKAQLSPDWLARFEASTAVDPWVYGFSAVQRQSGATVGIGGFKGPPAAGAVEIAYGVTVEQRSKGYATEIAEALVAYAFTSAEVEVVCAHTLLDSTASQRVLAKCGFEYVGELVDPEDGVVRRFEKRRPTK